MATFWYEPVLGGRGCREWSERGGLRERFGYGVFENARLAEVDLSRIGRLTQNTRTPEELTLS